MEEKEMFCEVLSRILNKPDQQLVGKCWHGMRTIKNPDDGPVTREEFRRDVAPNRIVVVPNVKNHVDYIRNSIRFNSEHYLKVRIKGPERSCVDEYDMLGKKFIFLMKDNHTLVDECRALDVDDIEAAWRSRRILPLYLSNFTDKMWFGWADCLRKLEEQGDEFLSWCVNFANTVDNGIKPGVKYVNYVPIFSFEHPEWNKMFHDASSEFVRHTRCWNYLLKKR